MKSLAIILAGLAAALPATARAQGCVGPAAPGTTRLVVEATGLRTPKGEVAFTVYPDDKRRFLAKGGKLLRARVPARAPVTRACFNLKPGSYAVAQYHDENGDRDFNRTLWTPKEGFGFSNDAPTKIGLPKLEAARFGLPAGGRTLRMQMRYGR
ncbi:DUF2141 domain-containing protein [Sphingomonas lenta]|uniref:DUF2141 domain-containing protein n=1 Tax=Sphingomonas lenta TaxID=1141887 RepID=A0A2A2SFQ7_9SPHN|nr:DUF2141 domain-containing protein [Sphingomonas lenta]PAX08087.1 hypothetical protein CKY28_10890 [Sphingomonas lenta]